MSKCRLCQKEASLKKSHLHPKFVYDWLKETGTTGRLRGAENVNIPVQDGDKIELLCNDCEQRFSVNEKYFAENIFYPYVNSLDEFMRRIEKEQVFSYDERLLRFIISLQWRRAVTKPKVFSDFNNSDKMNREVVKAEQAWSDYLLEKRKDTGVGSTYMIFFWNFIEAEGASFEGLPPRINSHLLRNVDSTYAACENSLFMYSKLGPIAFITMLFPTSVPKMPDCRVKRSGSISTSQILGNIHINEFLFRNRPSEINAIIEQISDTQKSKTIQRMQQNPDRAYNSQAYKVLQTDRELRKK